MPTIPDGANFGLHQVCPAIRPDCASSRRYSGGKQPVRPSLRPVHNRRRNAVRITTVGNAARAAGSRRCSWRTVATRFRPFLVWRRFQGTHSPPGCCIRGCDTPEENSFLQIFGPVLTSFRAQFPAGRRAPNTAGATCREKVWEMVPFLPLETGAKVAQNTPSDPFFRASGIGTICTYGTPVPRMSSACAMIIPAIRRPGPGQERQHPSGNFYRLPGCCLTRW